MLRGRRDGGSALDCWARKTQAEGSAEAAAWAAGDDEAELYASPARAVGAVVVAKISLCSLKRHARTRPLARSWW